MGELYRLVSPGEVTDDLEHWPFVKADPAEVLAEMGGERVWMCRHGHITEYPERCELDGCWVWIVKEADDRERRWVKGPLWLTGPRLSDAEVLAEMPTEALVEELQTRAVLWRAYCTGQMASWNSSSRGS